MNWLTKSVLPKIKAFVNKEETKQNLWIKCNSCDQMIFEKDLNKNFNICTTCNFHMPLYPKERMKFLLDDNTFEQIDYSTENQDILGFKDLIELQSSHETDIDVMLRNPEYDITKSIKKVSNIFLGEGDTLSFITEPVTFTAYMSADEKLPAPLVKLKKEISDYIFSLSQTQPDKLQVVFQEPEQSQGALARQILEDYGFQPMQTSLLDENQFYFYMLVTQGEQNVQLPFPESLNIEDFKRNFDAGLKRFSPGFMKTIAFYSPTETNDNPYAQYLAQQRQPFKLLKEQLGATYNIKETDLASGITTIRSGVTTADPRSSSLVVAGISTLQNVTAGVVTANQFSGSITGAAAN